MSQQRQAPPVTDAPDRFLRWQDVRAIVGLARSTVWRLIRAGTFPKPLRVNDSRRSSRWNESEILAWQRERREQAKKKGAA